MTRLSLAAATRPVGVGRVIGLLPRGLDNKDGTDAQG